MMQENKNTFVNNCDIKSVTPIMMALPYPPTQVRDKNQGYANLLSINYCGAVSEMSAITQYINNENRMAGERCSFTKTILGIAMAEMIHLQKLGELILLLGGSINYVAKYRDGTQRIWTPRYLKLPDHPREMLLADIESENAAIEQYKMHIKMISDDHINAILARIIKDEEYHIMILQALLAEF